MLSEPIEIDPGYQVYVLAPKANKVDVCPLQIIELDILALTVGIALTVMVSIAKFVLIQPKEFVPTKL